MRTLNISVMSFQIYFKILFKVHIKLAVLQQVSLYCFSAVRVLVRRTEGNIRNTCLADEHKQGYNHRRVAVPSLASDLAQENRIVV